MVTNLVTTVTAVTSLATTGIVRRQMGTGILAGTETSHAAINVASRGIGRTVPTRDKTGRTAQSVRVARVQVGTTGISRADQAGTTANRGMALAGMGTARVREAVLLTVTVRVQVHVPVMGIGLAVNLMEIDLAANLTKIGLAAKLTAIVQAENRTAIVLRGNPMVTVGRGNPMVIGLKEDHMVIVPTRSRTGNGARESRTGNGGTGNRMGIGRGNLSTETTGAGNRPIVAMKRGNHRIGMTVASGRRTVQTEVVGPRIGMIAVGSLMVIVGASRIVMIEVKDRPIETIGAHHPTAETAKNEPRTETTEAENRIGMIGEANRRTGRTAAESPPMVIEGASHIGMIVEERATPTVRAGGRTVRVEGSKGPTKIGILNVIPAETGRSRRTVPANGQTVPAIGTVRGRTLKRTRVRVTTLSARLV